MSATKFHTHIERHANIKFPNKTSGAKFAQKEIPAATYQRCGQMPIFHKRMSLTNGFMIWI
jgi:hypothetical protein